MTLRPGTRADVRAGVLPNFFRSSFGHVRRYGRLMVAVDDADTVVGAIAWSAPG